MNNFCLVPLLTPGCKELMETESHVRVAWSWLSSKEMASGQVGEAVALLKAEKESDPTGQTVAVNLCNMYAADLAINVDEKKIVAEVAEFYKFSSKVVNVHKKEMNKSLIDKIDKMLKDFKDSLERAERED